MTVLDTRALNRATLARQLLLDRADLPVYDAGTCRASSWFIPPSGTVTPPAFWLAGLKRSPACPFGRPATSESPVDLWGQRRSGASGVHQSLPAATWDWM